MTPNTPMLAFDLDRDVRALGAMAANLTPYLYEDELYGYLSGDLPRLTVGGLLMRLYRLTRLSQYLTPEQQSTVQDASINFEAERAEWSVHYEGKIKRELEARLGVLDRFLKECGEASRSCAGEYPTEAEKRTMIEHLRREAEARDVLPDDLAALLRHVDSRLRRVLTAGEFISDPRLKDVYPPNEFWWLYGHIPG